MKSFPHFKQSVKIFWLTSVLLACNGSGGSPNDNNEIRSQSAQHNIFDKLTGTWQNRDGKSFERWVKNSNGTYQATGFSIKGTDTFWNERANIYKENNYWVFENTVKGQNEGQSIRFTSVYVHENSVQFSNPDHDFPTDINYTLKDINTLDAFIVGPNHKGGKDTIPFSFRRLD